MFCMYTKLDHRTKLVLLLVVVFAAGVGAMSYLKSMEWRDGRGDRAVTPAALDGSSYRLESYGAIDVKDDERYLLAFQGGRLIASFCNAISGSYSTTNDTLTATLTSTKKYCGEPTYLMEIENMFNLAMQSGIAMERTDQTLTLTRSDGIQFIFSTFIDN